MGDKATAKALAAAILAGALSLPLAGALAQTTTTPAKAPGVHIELNKLEQQGEACRAYLLFENEKGAEYPVYRLDLVLFDKDGRIDRRIAVDASPLRAGKSVVKLFDLTGLQCSAISKILLNDISPCEDASGPRDDCVVSATLSTLTDVSFYK
ncbi:hypothetical protein SAMN06265365_104123 [Tistlia consotensis]|uniref:Tat pathway signal sequence domain protein n=1 Tax=Tistlia consotensis USBA 355 TaxID=560819 RepID=A0A1Y6BPX3_9PROT|nr:hypothetical protein [Tistlia consotensis]SMF22308.1 hypothetical protein SAMN05428998_107171 [Tistlia consotensis USBA 355]SNR46116.1 hypothetical protein SAMN06265365_104123 [Tistlia consotensis]